MNLAKPSLCSGCVLQHSGKAFSRPYGTGVNGVMIVGDDLEESDIRDGFPFSPAAPSGHVLEGVFRSLSMDRKQFVLWNILACVPPYVNTGWEYPAIAHCSNHFRRVMEEFSPRVIVACGVRATRTLTHLTGKKMRLDDIQGFPLEAPDYPSVRVIPTYSPWQIRNGQWQCFPILRLAVAKAVRIARDGWKEPEFSFAPDATVEQLGELADYLEGNPLVNLNFDFETDGGRLELPASEDDEDEEEIEEVVETKGAISTDARITQVNFSVEEDSGYAIAYNAQAKPVVQRILTLSNPKNGHNVWGYDLPVAAHNGLVINGVVYDTLWMFHHLYPDLPGSYKKQSDDTKKDQGSMASLQYCASFYNAPFPWKHLRLEQSGYYGCLDGANGIRVFNGVKEDMEEMGVWESYLTFVQRLRPILANAEKRGIPMNREKLQRFIDMLMIKEQERLAELRPLIPIALRPAKQTNGLKKTPKDTTGLVQRTFRLEEPEQCNCVKKTRATKCKPCQGTGIITDNNGDTINCETCGTTGKTAPTITPNPNCSTCEGKGVIKGNVIRWCALKEFNPNSHVQMKEYAAYRLHRIPKNSKRKYAMDKETLERLYKTHNDPVYKITMDAKSIKKMKGTYGEGWLKRMGEDDCVHTQFLFLPASGQLSCLAGYVPVTTSNGKIPIGKLRIGDKVWTHQKRWKRITALWLKGVAPMVRLHLSNGTHITCTEDHKFLAWKDEHQYKLVNACQSENNSAVGVGFQHSHQSAASQCFGSVAAYDNRSIAHGTRGGAVWTRVRDLINGRGKTVFSSLGGVEDVRPKEASERMGDTPHRRKQDEQPYRQLGISDRRSTQEASLFGEDCFAVGGYVTITQVDRMGSLPVYDISVEDDESYEACGVFSHNSTNPNVQNAPHPLKGPPLQREFATEFRDAVEAKPGYVLIELDYKSYHAQTLAWEAKDWNYLRLAKLDIHSYLAGQMLRVDGYRQALYWDDEKLGAWLKDIKKKHEKVRNEQAKPCIAEGQLVLTDAGLVPIELVTLEHKVWDGIEWVSHEGVICKGVKEVITHDGLTATPDHRVYCEGGVSLPFRIAQRQAKRLERSGNGRKALRTLDRYEKCGEGQEKLECGMQVQMRKSPISGFVHTQTRSNIRMQRVSQLQDCDVSVRRKGTRLRHAFRFYFTQVPVSKSKRMGEVRWTWNRTKNDTKSVYSVRVENTPSRVLQRSGDRPQRQQRALRTRQFDTVNTARKHEQSIEHDLYQIPRTNNTTVNIPKSFRSVVHTETSERKGHEWRSDYRTRTAKVYDIVNAGPRRRYTVENRLVSNCILGYGFGMGASRLYRTNPDNFRNLSEAQGVFSALSSAFPQAAQYREDSPELAHKQKYLKSAFDCIRWFWNVKTYDFQKHEWTHGQDWDKAIAFRPANDAFCQKKLALLRCEEKGYTKKYGFINDLHDAFKFHCKETLVEECIYNVQREMQLPSEVMLMPDSTGFSVDVDVKMGKTWAKMEEFKRSLIVA